MTDTKSTSGIYPRLCVAYFCQFAIWGAWAGALGEFAASGLKFSGGEIGSLYNAIPFGAVIAPLFIGPIADRYFSAQKVIALLHLIGGLALLACGWLCLNNQQSFPLLMGLMLLSGICFMPTMGLLNSIVFKHLPNANMAPRVFVFGTIGWIVVNLFIAAFCGGAETPWFFIVSGGVCVFLAVYASTLPDTPPKGAPAPGEKTAGSGLGVLSLFKDFSFVTFVLCAFLASIPACNYFFPSQVPFLTQRGYPSPVALTTINQFSEILFMLALPFCIPRFGLKKVLLVGMGAWAIRYFCFSQPSFPFALAGLMLHGFCYTFLYVASYMYAEKVAPAHLKASAQSMMVFLLLGVGQVLGGYGYGFMSEKYAPQYNDITVAQAQLTPADDVSLNDFAGAVFKVPIPAWNDDENSAFQYLDLAKQVNKLLGKEKEES
ncbi:MAG: MFS transporter, partial [Planctomycetaceae bacterium]|nr:MFS transporter [Planctomycetaceae bacterium]